MSEGKLKEWYVKEMVWNAKLFFWFSSLCNSQIFSSIFDEFGLVYIGHEICFKNWMVINIDWDAVILCKFWKDLKLMKILSYKDGMCTGLEILTWFTFTILKIFSSLDTMVMRKGYMRLWFYISKYHNFWFPCFSSKN